MWACTLYSEVAKLRPDVEFQDNLLFLWLSFSGAQAVIKSCQMATFCVVQKGDLNWRCHHFSTYKHHNFYLNDDFFTDNKFPFSTQKNAICWLFLTTWVREQEPEKKPTENLGLYQLFHFQMIAVSITCPSLMICQKLWGPVLPSSYRVPGTNIESVPYSGFPNLPQTKSSLSISICQSKLKRKCLSLDSL